MQVVLTGDEPPIEYVDGWAVMERDPATGRLLLARIEEGAGPGGADIWRWREVQDCTALVAENAAVRSEQDGQRYREGNTLVARVPMNVWSQRLHEAIRQGDHAYMRRFLNDQDHASFRTKSGRI